MVWWYYCLLYNARGRYTLPRTATLVGTENPPCPHRDRVRLCPTNVLSHKSHKVAGGWVKESEAGAAARCAATGRGVGKHAMRDAC